MPKIAIAIDSDFEPTTEAPSKYRQSNVYPYLESKGITIVRCNGIKARRSYVAPEAHKAGVVYLTGVGHGFPRVYTGYFYEPIFVKENYDPQESQDKIIHLLSCETALELGPDFVTRGCRAFFGYDVIYKYPLGSAAEIFFECDAEIDRAFADGLNAGHVYTRVRALFDKHIGRLRATGDSGDSYNAAILEHNRDHLCAPTVGARWGSVQAKL